MLANCIFCRIASGEIPAQIVLETKTVVVFRDNAPQAPHHLLAIPREHRETIGELVGRENEIFKAIAEAAKAVGIVESGYRVVVNQGDDAGQAVPHVHFHILGGRSLTWPPG